MKEELRNLYLKLSAVETTGRNTIVMADALITLSKLIEKAETQEESDSQ